MSDKLYRSKKYMYAFIFITVLTANVMNAIMAKQSLSVFMFSFIEKLCLMLAYVNIACKPISVAAYLFLYSIIGFLKQLVLGYTLADVIVSSGAYIIFTLIGLIAQTNMIKLYKENLKARIVRLAGYERSLFKTPWWSKIICYSILITVIFTTANGDGVETVSNSTFIRLAATVAIMIEPLEIIAMLTSTDISLQVMILDAVIQIFAVGYLIGFELLTIPSAMILVLFLIIIGYNIWLINNMDDSKLTCHGLEDNK